LGNHRQVMGNCGRRDPGIIERHALTTVLERESQCGPRVRDLQINRKGI
jgi:hypothetical protein